MRSLHDPRAIHFGSDNYAGAHPEVLEALGLASGGHVRPYGDDPYTQRLRDWARGTFGEAAQIFPVFNGTGANLLALSSVTPRWGGVVAAVSAHINVDETGAPEITGGLKITVAESEAGKLSPAALTAARSDPAFIHESQTTTVSVSNSTELGTVYTPDEFRALADAAHAEGMAVHLDGARLANAAAALGADLGELTAGADIVSLGATKNGGMNAEAVVVIDPARVSGIEYLHKVLLQLSSKARYASAQLVAMYDGDLWLRCASHANAMAALLAERLTAAGFAVPLPVEANAVIVQIEPEVAQAVRAEGFLFYDWPAIHHGCRLMCAWDTPAEHVEALVSRLAAHRAAGPNTMKAETHEGAE